jgi:hypothetical protein
MQAMFNNGLRDVSFPPDLLVTNSYDMNHMIHTHYYYRSAMQLPRLANARLTLWIRGFFTTYYYCSWYEGLICAYIIASELRCRWRMMIFPSWLDGNGFHFLSLLQMHQLMHQLMRMHQGPITVIRPLMSPAGPRPEVKLSWWLSLFNFNERYETHHSRKDLRPRRKHVISKSDQMIRPFGNALLGYAAAKPSRHFF